MFFLSNNDKMVIHGCIAKLNGVVYAISRDMYSIHCRNINSLGKKEG